MANQKTEEALSLEVSTVLDYLGYHPDNVNWRRNNYEFRVEFINKSASSGRRSYPLYLYLTGSKRDGTSIWAGGDEDWMWEVDKFKEKQDHLLVFKKQNVSPGYTYLQLATPSLVCQQQSVINFLVKPSIIYDNFLSSQLMNKALYDKLKLGESFYRQLHSDVDYDGFGLKDDDSKNPKVVFTFYTVIDSPPHTADIVPAFSYESADKYTNWANRERKHGWPPRRVIERVLQLPVHVVPKGQKGSKTCSKEFRICYTYAEMELMENLNETQTKIYVLLKMLFKSVIDKKFPDIVTSYALKNVVFWISEQTPLQNFTKASLLYQFYEALKFIIQRLQEGNLPNYFIPERNLLQGRISPGNDVQPLINCLSDFVSDGPNCVLKIPAIKEGLHAISNDGWEYLAFCRNVAEKWLVDYQMFWCFVRESEIEDLLSYVEDLLKMLTD